MSSVAVARPLSSADQARVARLSTSRLRHHAVRGRLRYLEGPEVGRACRGPLTDSRAAYCVLERVNGRPLGPRTRIEVIQDRYGTPPLRTVTFRLLEDGVPVAGSEGSVLMSGTTVDAYMGQAHVVLDELRSRTHRRALSERAVQRIVAQRGANDYRRFFDPERARFVILMPEGGSTGWMIEREERSGRERRLPPMVAHDLTFPTVRTRSQVARGLEAPDCLEQPSGCNVNALRTVTTTVTQLREEVTIGGQVVVACTYSGEAPENLGNPVEHQISQAGSPSIPQTCTTATTQSVDLGSEPKRFVQTWLTDIARHAVTSPMYANVNPSSVDPLQVQIKNLTRRDICITTANGCVLNNFFGPFRMELRLAVLGEPGAAGPTDQNNVASLGLLSHEYGHVLSHAAGVLDGVAIALDKELGDKRLNAGNEGFADAFKVSYALFRSENPRPGDQLTLDSTINIGGRPHSAALRDTLFGVSFPVPRGVRARTVQNLNIGVHEALRCASLRPHECGQGLPRAFWFAYWNRLPADSRRLALTPSDPLVATLDSDPQTNVLMMRENARVALAATMVSGAQNIHDQLANFRRELLALTPSSEQSRVEEMFRLLCIDASGGRHPACDPQNRYPKLAIPVTSMRGRQFGDAVADPAGVGVAWEGWETNGPRPGDRFEVRGLSLNGDAEHFVGAEDMVLEAGASRETMFIDNGQTVERVRLAAAGGSVRMPVVFPGTGIASVLAYPFRLLSGLSSASSPSLTIKAVDASGAERTSMLDHPINDHPGTSFFPPGFELRGASPFQSLSTAPGSGTLRIEYAGGQGDVFLYGMVLRASCAGPGGTVTDSDGDGLGDGCDPVPCGGGLFDTDGDGLCDGDDNCPFHDNILQHDFDGDGIGNACDPCDRSSKNVSDPQGRDPRDLAAWMDTDNDGVCDIHDNCNRWNPAQADRDGDGVGDACDLDRDGDGLASELDLCPDEPPPVGSSVHLDDDGDGVGNACDCSPGGASSAADFSTGWEHYETCRDLRERSELETHLEAIRALAGVYEDLGFKPPFDGPWSQLYGCLAAPCTLAAPSPALHAAAEAYALEGFELGYATRSDLLAFTAEQATSDLHGFDLTNFVDWLVETRGEGLARP